MEDGVCFDSAEFSGMPNREAIRAMTRKAESEGLVRVRLISSPGLADLPAALLGSADPDYV